MKKLLWASAATVALALASYLLHSSITGPSDAPSAMPELKPSLAVGTDGALARSALISKLPALTTSGPTDNLPDMSKSRSSPGKTSTEISDYPALIARAISTQDPELSFEAASAISRCRNNGNLLRVVENNRGNPNHPDKVFTTAYEYAMSEQRKCQSIDAAQMTAAPGLLLTAVYGNIEGAAVRYARSNPSGLAGAHAEIIRSSLLRDAYAGDRETLEHLALAAGTHGFSRFDQLVFFYTFDVADMNWLKPIVRSAKGLDGFSLEEEEAEARRLAREIVDKVNRREAVKQGGKP